MKCITISQNNSFPANWPCPITSYAADSTKEKKNSKKKFPCGRCCRSFNDKRDRDKHWIVHPVDDDKGFSNEFCHGIFITEKSRNQHVGLCHGVDFNAEQKCPKCCVVLCGSKALRTHLKLHPPEGEDYFQCEYCAGKFYNDLSLKKHVGRYHNDEDIRYTCPHENCDFITRYRNTFKNHQLIHDRIEGDFNCDKCKSNFLTKRALDYHCRH